MCTQGETLALEIADTTTTGGGTVVIDGTAFDGMGYLQNTIYCVNETSGGKRDVTNETY